MATRGFFGFLCAVFCCVSAIDLDSGTLGDAHLFAVLPLADELEADAGRLAILGVGHRQVGQMDRALLGDDPAFLLRGLALVALDHVDAAHQRAIVRGTHLDHLAGTALVAEFARHRPEDAGSHLLHLWGDQHRRVAVEADDGAVGALDVLGDAHHHGLHHFALLHAAARNGFLHRNDDDVADGGVFALGAAQHLDAHDAARAGIVRPVEVGLHLDHDAALFVVPNMALLNFLLLVAADHFPALELGDRAALLDPHRVADGKLVLLVMRVIFLRTANYLLHRRV